MATQTPSTDAGDRFIAALFEPLPAGVEPVEPDIYLNDECELVIIRRPAGDDLVPAE